MSSPLSAASVLLALGVLAVSTSTVLGQSGLSREGSEYRAVSTLSGDQVQPQMSLSPAGGYIVWQDNATDGDGLGISARRVNANASGEGEPFRVNANAELDQEKPSVTRLTNGGTVFAWQSGRVGFQRVFVRFMNADGVFITGDVPIGFSNGNQQIAPSVAALTDGSAVVVWSESGQDGSMLGVFGQRFTNAGVAGGNPFGINQFKSFNQRSPSVAVIGTGGIVVVWASEQQLGENSVDIFGRLYAPDLSAVGDEFRVTVIDRISANPSVARTAEGGFAVAWSQLEQGVNGWDVMVRYFDGNGAALTGAARVNTEYRGDQYAPRLDSVEDHQLVVWTSQGQDGFQEGVFGQILKGRGEKVGTELRVNTTTASQQIHPMVRSDGASRIVVGWTSFSGLATGFDLMAQRFGFGSQVILPAPPVPFVAAVDQRHLSVTWAEVSGYEIGGYELYLDGSATPIVTTETFSSVGGSTWGAGSTHTVQLAYRLKTGQRSALSVSVTGKTWGADQNGDGLPDDWQSFNWGQPRNWPTAGMDSDGDQATNLQEFLAGTDPTDPESVLRLWRSSSSQGVRLNWSTEGGLVYQVQITSDFRVWTNVGKPRFATGGQDSIPVTEQDNARYYRVIRLR